MLLGNQSENGFGYQLGEYESTKKRLVQERKNDYNRHLAEQNAKAQTEVERKIQQKQQQLQYDQVLRRKREEEMRYRDINDPGSSVNNSTHAMNVQKLPVTPYHPDVIHNQAIPIASTNNIDSYSPSFADKTSMKRSGEILSDAPRPEPVVVMSPSWLQPSMDSSATSSNQGNKPAQPSVSKYREELERQIEERKARQADIKAKEREEEEKLAQRIEDQRIRMLKEYEFEQEAKKKREEEVQRKRELLVQKQQELQKQVEEQRKQRHGNKMSDKSNYLESNSAARAKSPPLPTYKKFEDVRSNSPTIAMLKSNGGRTRAHSNNMVAEKPKETIAVSVVEDLTIDTPPAEIIDQVTSFRQQIRNEQNLKKPFQMKCYRVSSGAFLDVPSNLVDFQESVPPLKKPF